MVAAEEAEAVQRFPHPKEAGFLSEESAALSRPDRAQAATAASAGQDRDSVA